MKFLMHSRIFQDEKCYGSVKYDYCLHLRSDCICVIGRSCVKLPNDWKRYQNRYPFRNRRREQQGVKTCSLPHHNHLNSVVGSRGCCFLCDHICMAGFLMAPDCWKKKKSKTIKTFNLDCDCQVDSDV